MPVTSVARTLLECAADLDLLIARGTRHDEPVADPGVRVELAAQDVASIAHEHATFRPLPRWEIRRLLERSRGRRAVSILRRALALVDAGCAGTWSGLERAILAEILRRALPVPHTGVTLVIAGSELRPDMHWPDHGVVLEGDGIPHRRRRTQLDDAARDELYAHAGLAVVRVRPDAIAAGVDQLARRLSR